MPETPQLRRFRFGAYEVDFRLGELRKFGRRLKLSGQPLLILERLLARPGDLVTRDELRQELWPADTFVDFEHNLNSAVKRLRTALGDSADAPRFIETVPRRGYRFVAAVEALEQPGAMEPKDAGHQAPPAEPPSPVGPAPGGPGPAVHRWLVPVGGALALLAVVAAVLAFRGETPPDPRPSLAVLPFENLSGDAAKAYLADGTTEALIAELAQVRALTVISRTSVMRFQGARLPLSAIARELGVTSIVEGSVTTSGDDVRITVQLIDAATDRHLWAETYAGGVGELFALQGRAARAVAREVHAALSPPEEARLARARTTDPAVQEAYLRAQYFWNQRTPDGLARAIDYFNEAVTADATYAPARAGLAEAYNLLPRYGTAQTREALRLARDHAEAALRLDAELPQAHAALGKVRHSLDWDWAGAERSFRRAVELSPGYSTAHQWYSVFLLTVGRVDEGIAEARRARELDPLSPVINLHLAFSLAYADRLDEAEASIERALELEPRYANAFYLRGWLQLRRRQAEAALATFRTATELASLPREYFGGLAAAAVAANRPAEARRILDDLRATATGAEQSGQPLFWALVALGRQDEAFAILERDFANRSVCFYLFDVVNHWFLEPVRADPRLRPLFAQAGLETLIARGGGAD